MRREPSLHVYSEAQLDPVWSQVWDKSDNIEPSAICGTCARASGGRESFAVTDFLKYLHVLLSQGKRLLSAALWRADAEEGEPVFLGVPAGM